MERSGLDNFLIDGFPRALDQAKVFEDQIGPPSAVLFFDCPEEEMEKRLLKRGALKFTASPAPGETSGRSDDNIATIKKRFKTFVEQSVPVVEDYASRGLAFKISAVPPPNEVYEEVQKALMQVMGPLADANIVFVVGGPGSGKGTQCQKIAKDFGYTHFSTGDLLRDEVARGSPLGRQVASIVQEGQLVPDDMIVDLIKKKMIESEAKDFLLDGFPRTLAQAIAFDEQVKKPSAAMLLECPQDELEKRVLKRGETSGRGDDNLEIVRKRFEIFREQSLPVIERYEPMLAYKVTSSGTISETYTEVKRVIEGLRHPLLSAKSMETQDKLQKLEHHHSAGKLMKLTDPMGELDVIFVLGGPGYVDVALEACFATLPQQAMPGAINSSKLSLLYFKVWEGHSMQKVGGQVWVCPPLGRRAPAARGGARKHHVIIKKAMLEAAQEVGAKRFIIDGFPRSAHQAEVFEMEVKRPMAVLHLNCSEETMVKRLSHLGESQRCLYKPGDTLSSSRHLMYPGCMPPRYATYLESTLPVIETYEKQGLAFTISSEGTEEAVFDEVCKVVNNVHHMEVAPSHRTPLLCISGPSGAGKSTLIGKLKKEFKKMVGFSVSHTTKDPRKGDVDGEDYYFTDRASMQADIDAGKFLEHAEIHGQLYGTSFAAVQQVLDEGKVCILDIDVQGVKEVKSNPSAVKGMFVFVRPPSMEALAERLKKRGTDSEEAMHKRLSNAEAEIKTAASSNLYDITIVNEEIDVAYDKLKEYLHDKLPATFTNASLVAKKAARNGAKHASIVTAASGKFDADLGVREYMQAKIVPVLKAGMNALNSARPEDPLQFLADYLVSHKADLKV
eukprot:scaffold118992_cov36-Prasinocladus_malaysianus.AAC.3